MTNRKPVAGRGRRRPSSRRGGASSAKAAKVSGDANLKMRQRMLALEGTVATLQISLEHWIGAVMQEHPNLISDEEE